eukprot:s1345_g5.t1
MYWDVVPMKTPHTRSDWQTQPETHWDVDVTAKGNAKLDAAKSDTAHVRLVPGVDFKRKEREETPNKVFYGPNSGNALRHGWYLQRRLRPLCPHLATSPSPSKWGDETEQNAKLTMAYFRAWTLDKKRGNKAVPYIRQLRGAEDSWEQSLRKWLLHLPCEETKRYVGNFLAVYRVRPEGSMQHLPCESRRTRREWKMELPPDLVVDAMERAEVYWRASSRHCKDVPNPYADADHANIVKGLRRKKKHARTLDNEAVVMPEVTSEITDLSKRKASVAEWVENVHDRCNAEQALFCKTVAQQVLAQLNGEDAATQEPLRWALHGGPGTGKSYTLNLIRKELFEDILGWKQGSEFQIVTLQAVMANDLEGDTLHHAFGLNWQGAGDEKISGHKLLELSAKAIEWRWLIIDEISMVSAELLARVELRCRELVRDLSQSKYAKDSAMVRPFGGLNVILAGDLWQLPPPRGTFVGDVPWEMLTQGKSKKAAHTARGQQLVWGAMPDGVHGVTELVQCERTHDVWLQNLQTELRSGKLSEANHSFLHGKDTCVPGSWNGKELDCANGACQDLLDAKVDKKRIRRLECRTCQTYKQGAVVDMQIGEAVDPLTVYIAATRVKDRTGLFIYRPFEAAPFQKGVKVGRDPLLRQWRGEAIDWAALRAKYREERPCSECKEQKPAAGYTTGQWKRTDAARVCKECVKRHADVGQPWQCMTCNAWKEKQGFAETYARPQCTFFRICTTCEKTKLCAGCGARKAEENFSAAAWKRTRAAGARLCLVCARQAHGLWTCNKCKIKKAKGSFQTWALRNGDQNGQQVCDRCQTPELARSIVARAIERLAATQVKVARQRHEKVIAEVVAEIARKRKLDWRAAGENHRKAARAEAQRQTRPEPSVTEAEPLPTERDVTQAAPIRFQYVCPFCEGEVSSSVRSGQVNHRGACGRKFQVKDGHVAAKEFVYTCPYCKGTVRSKVETGRVDHRGICGNQFRVQNGAVTSGTRRHAHTCPLCRTVVWSSRAAGRIQVKHTAPSGQPCSQTSWTAELDLQACELGRLQSELSTRPRIAPSAARASLAVPAAPSEACPTAPAAERKPGSCVTWLWAMVFCLLLLMGYFYQVSAAGQLRHSASAEPWPSLSSAKSKVSHTASDQVHHLRVQSMWEGNGSSGDELTMITPAPSKSFQLGSTTDSTANAGQVKDTQQPETEAQVDKAEETGEADATQPEEERRPDLMSEDEVEAKASATEEPETAAQVDKAEETGEADATQPEEERQPDVMSEDQVEAKASATEEPETAAQVDKAEETRETDATPPEEERQPDAMSEDQVEAKASATEEPETAAQVDKAEETREADATQPEEERQPDLMSEDQVEDKASATEEPETAAQVDKEEETRETDATPPEEEKQPDLMSEDQVEAKAAAREEPETEAQVDKEVESREDSASWLCDAHLTGFWKKAACNATPWHCGLAFLGGSRTLAPDCDGEDSCALLRTWTVHDAVGNGMM